MTHIPFSVLVAAVVLSFCSQSDARIAYRNDHERSNREVERLDFSHFCGKNAKSCSVHPHELQTPISFHERIPPPSWMRRFTGQPKWKHFGIQGVGVISSIDYDKTNAQHLLMGTEGSGLYRSINFGQSWVKLNFPSQEIRRVVIDSANSSHYLVIAKEIEKEVMLYDSQDNGANWKSINPWTLGTDGAKRIVRPIDVSIIKGVVTLLGEFEKTPEDLSEIKGFGDIHNNIEEMGIVQQTGTIDDQSPFLLRLQVLGRPLDNMRLKIKETGVGLVKILIPAENYAKDYNVTPTLYSTTNFGNNWIAIFSATTNEIGEVMSGMGYDISSDGKRIYYSDKPSQVTFSKTNGQTWQTQPSKFDGYPSEVTQDLVISDSSEDHIALFGYMAGMLESSDGGKSFSSVINETGISFIDLIALEYPDKPDPVQVGPLDLRLGGMKNVNNIFLLPTDQGIFFYDGILKTLTNVAPSLYLAASGKVSVTSCPRIYSGLFHVGGYWVNPNGSIEGSETVETLGFATGADDGCNTPTFSQDIGYFYDGVHRDNKKSAWFNNNRTDFGLFSDLGLHYNEGWWYFFRSNGLKCSRIYDDFTAVELIQPTSNNVPFNSVGFEEEKNQMIQETPPAIWALSEDRKLWSSLDGMQWTLREDFNAMKIFVTNYFGNISVQGQQVIFFGPDELMIGDLSKTGPEKWYVVPGKSSCTAVTHDRCGTVYAACKGGVYSSPNGMKFTKLGTGDEYSRITSLAVDHHNNVLYASTWGESLLRFPLDNCPIIQPVTPIMPPWLIPLFPKVGPPPDPTLPMKQQTPVSGQ